MLSNLTLKMTHRWNNKNDVRSAPFYSNGKSPEWQTRNQLTKLPSWSNLWGWKTISWMTYIHTHTGTYIQTSMDKIWCYGMSNIDSKQIKLTCWWNSNSISFSVCSLVVFITFPLLLSFPNFVHVCRCSFSDIVFVILLFFLIRINAFVVESLMFQPKFGTVLLPNILLPRPNINWTSKTMFY